MEELFVKATLYTDNEGYARFRDEKVPLREAGKIGFLSDIFGARGYQLRHSPLGFESGFHCTTEPQWVFILHGIMEIELADGTTRSFKAGESFFSDDRLPIGQEFKEGIHGHRSRQVGDQPLRTLFLKV